MRAYGSCLIVKQDNESHKSFILPDKKANTGKVVSAGPWCEHVRDGDVVMFDGQYVGMPLNYQGQTYAVMREDHIWGILDDR